MGNNSPPSVLITGGGKRIGLALAKAFLQQNISVIISYRTHDSEVISELTRQGALCLPADFSTHSGIYQFAEQVKQRTGKLRALIHNASDWLPEQVDVKPEETLAAMLQIHTYTPYLLNLLLEECLTGQGSAGADIIHLTDYVVERGSADHIAYAASKAALDNMTRSFAAKLAPDVKVNSIAPALILFRPEDDERYRQRALDKSLMKIAPGENEIIAAVHYLMQSNYVTGQTISVDGGRHLR